MPRLEAGQPIVMKDGTMTQQFRDLMLDLVRYLPILGEGSPEGVVRAPQYSLYIDTTATGDPVEYRKIEDSIGGDPKQGWVAV